MKLSYRGVSYQQETLNLEVNQGEIGGKYRGQYWKQSYPRHIPHLQPKIFLQYRGIAYSTCPIPKSNEPEKYLWESNLDACKRSLNNNCSVISQDPTSIHLENIRRNLERRLQVAQAKGDEKLVNLLRKESQQLALNL